MASMHYAAAKSPWICICHQEPTPARQHTQQHANPHAPTRPLLPDRRKLHSTTEAAHNSSQPFLSSIFCNKKHVTVAHMLFEPYSTITTLRHPCEDRTPAVQHQAPQTFPNPRRCMPPQTTALQSPEQLVALLLPLSLPCSPMSPPTKTSQTPCSHAVTCCDTL